MLQRLKSLPNEMHRSTWVQRDHRSISAAKPLGICKAQCKLRPRANTCQATWVPCMYRYNVDAAAIATARCRTFEANIPQSMARRPPMEISDLNGVPRRAPRTRCGGVPLGTVGAARCGARPSDCHAAGDRDGQGAPEQSKGKPFHRAQKFTKTHLGASESLSPI